MDEVEKIWLNGEIVDWSKASIHMLTHALHYGTGVFEGIRCYDTEKGPAVFRFKEHLDRLFKSADTAGMELPFQKEDLRKASFDLIKLNNIKECYIRPIAYLGYGKMGLNPIDCKVDVAVAVWPWGPYLGEEGIKNGITTKISSYSLFNMKKELNQAKISGFYISSALAKAEAIKEGFDEALLLDNNKNISEGTGENVFAVFDGTLVTPPLDHILEGITRDSVIRIAKDNGIEVVERDIPQEEIFKAEEVFLTGTAAEVTPIREIDGKQIGEGKPGSITKLIQEKYFDAIHGKVFEYESWLDFVGK